MMSQGSFFRWATAVLGVAAFSAVFSAAVYCMAEDPAGDSSRRDKSDRSIREQDIYIPYAKLRQVFEKQGRGVFLPYEQFQELWQAAREKTQPAAEPKPPAGGLITDITSDATVEKDVVRVKATLRDRDAGRRLALDPAAAGRRRRDRRDARAASRRGSSATPPTATSCSSRRKARSRRRWSFAWNMPRPSRGCRASTASRSRRRSRRSAVGGS